VDLLLDTQIWLWIQADPGRIGRELRAALDNPANSVHVSAASFWEISIKWSIGRLSLPDAPATYIPARLAGEPILTMNIQLEHVLRVSELPLVHSDPFDRLLVAQAMVSGFTIATSDRKLQQYEVRTLHN
jgi:PIN domain nuclease of toxin-antitoxin system